MCMFTYFYWFECVAILVCLRFDCIFSLACRQSQEYIQLWVYDLGVMCGGTLLFE